jgi:biopolymer transport protein TolR
MGMSLGKARKGRGRRRAPIGEINVTPMVDVMLVLLIVFMVASPLMTVGVPIDLPQASASPIPLEKPPMSITVTADGTISVDREPVSEETLLAAIAAKSADGTDERLLIRGDTATAYGMVMKVMGLLSSAGYSRIGLVTEPGAQQ